MPPNLKLCNPRSAAVQLPTCVECGEKALSRQHQEVFSVNVCKACCKVRSSFFHFLPLPPSLSQPITVSFPNRDGILHCLFRPKTFAWRAKEKWEGDSWLSLPYPRFLPPRSQIERRVRIRVRMGLDVTAAATFLLFLWQTHSEKYGVCTKTTAKQDYLLAGIAQITFHQSPSNSVFCTRSVL